MVLQPIFDSEPAITSEYLPAWSVVERQQTAKTTAWWLVTQPDHAGLSGEIAAHISAPGFPTADTQIVHAIASHDAGWNLFEADRMKAVQVHPDGRPVSFFEIEPQTFLRAWTASIDRAQEDSAAGAYMVSQHFSWLGEFRLERAGDPPDVQAQIRSFLKDERTRQEDLKAANGGSSSWDTLLPLLQFCDLFSLYLCSGARQPVEFPLDFPAGRIRVQYENDTCVLHPSPFLCSWDGRVPARHYPQSPDTARISLTLSLK